VAAVVLGLLPQPFLRAAEPSLAGIVSQSIPFNPADPEVSLDVLRTAAENTADTSLQLPSDPTGAEIAPTSRVPVAASSVDLTGTSSAVATESSPDSAHVIPASARAGNEETGS